MVNRGSWFDGYFSPLSYKRERMPWFVVGESSSLRRRDRVPLEGGRRFNQATPALVIYSATRSFHLRQWFGDLENANHHSIFFYFLSLILSLFLSFFPLSLSLYFRKWAIGGRRLPSAHNRPIPSATIAEGLTHHRQHYVISFIKSAFKASSCMILFKSALQLLLRESLICFSSENRVKLKSDAHLSSSLILPKKSSRSDSLGSTVETIRFFFVSR